MDRTKLILWVIPLVVAGALWRLSSHEKIAVPPVALQLSAPGAPTATASVPAAASPATQKAASVADHATVVTAAKVPASQPANGETPDDYVFVPTPQPRRELRAESPAAAKAVSPVAVKLASIREVRTASASARVTSPAAPLNYERHVSDAAAAGAADLDRAARRLDQLTADAPTRPEAFEALAAIRLRQGDYYQAAVALDAALRNGGKASFVAMHDHSRGNFDKGADATCVGALTIQADQVTFESEDGHRFATTWPDLLEVGSNRFFGSGVGGFHVKVSVDGKSRNFNLAPRSRDKREASLILDLLIDNAERHDASK